MAPVPAFQYNDSQFRAQFPVFADTTAYPQATLAQYFTTSGMYVANSNYGRIDPHLPLPIDGASCTIGDPDC